MITTKSSITAEDLLYPKSKPYDTGYLDVGDGHQIYYQQIGNPDGPPVLIVHGGPGLGIAVGSVNVRLHDPSYFRIIAVDQRGCGQSKPHFADNPKAAVRSNTPDALVDDFEKIKHHLNIDKWHVYGYSWGSGLGAYYTAHHPKSVMSLTIGGIWMHTPQEIDWYINRMGLFFPEAEADLLAQLPKSVKRFERLAYLYKAIVGTDKKLALKIGEAQGRFEDVATSFHAPEPEVTSKKKQTASEKEAERRMMISLGALEIFFMKETPLSQGWYKAASVKKALKSVKDFVMVQGRYDIVCPPTTAYEMHQAHPHSKLVIVHYAGHRMLEPQMLQAILKENARLKFKE